MDNATKRSLKKPDQFVALTESGVHWADQHRQKTIIAAVALDRLRNQGGART